MKTKWVYWLRYNSLDFAASIYKAPEGMSPDEFDWDWSGEYRGPFKKISEARANGIWLVQDDIREFRGMIEHIKKGHIEVIYPKPASRKTKQSLP